MGDVNYGDVNAWVVLFTVVGADTHYVYLKSESQPEMNDVDPSAFVIDYPSLGHFGTSLNSEKVIIKISKVYAITKAKWDEIKKGIKVLKASSNNIYYRLQVTSGGLFESFNGVGTTKGDLMPVVIKTINGKKKRFNGDTTIYEIGQIQLQQSGALEDSA